MGWTFASNLISEYGQVLGDLQLVKMLYVYCPISSNNGFIAQKLLLNSDKMLDKPRILSLSPNSFN